MTFYIGNQTLWPGSANALFNPDALHNRVIGVCSALGQHDSGSHRHQMGQLLFTRQGCVRLTLNGALLCLLPPTRAAWIPAGIDHRAEMKSIVDYRSVVSSDPLSCPPASSGDP
jgi:hypothetical protein